MELQRCLYSAMFNPEEVFVLFTLLLLLLLLLNSSLLLLLFSFPSKLASRRYSFVPGAFCMYIRPSFGHYF